MKLPTHPATRVRWLLMSAHLYYDRASPVLSDSEFDALSRRVAADMELSELFEGLPQAPICPYQLWLLGEDADALRAGACHVKITYACVGGAEAWHQQVFGMPCDSPYVLQGEFSEEHKVTYARTGG